MGCGPVSTRVAHGLVQYVSQGLSEILRPSGQMGGVVFHGLRKTRQAHANRSEAVNGALWPICPGCSVQDRAERHPGGSNVMQDVAPDQGLWEQQVLHSNATAPPPPPLLLPMGAPLGAPPPPAPELRTSF